MFQIVNFKVSATIPLHTETCPSRLRSRTFSSWSRDISLKQLSSILSLNHLFPSTFRVLAISTPSWRCPGRTASRTRSAWQWLTSHHRIRAIRTCLTSSLELCQSKMLPKFPSPRLVKFKKLFVEKCIKNFIFCWLIKSVKSVDSTNAKAIDSWIKNISALQKNKPIQTVNYQRAMPSVENLMQIWPQEYEDLLKEVI